MDAKFYKQTNRQKRRGRGVIAVFDDLNPGRCTRFSKSQRRQSRLQSWLEAI